MVRISVYGAGIETFANARMVGVGRDKYVVEPPAGTPPRNIRVGFVNTSLRRFATYAANAGMVVAQRVLHRSSRSLPQPRYDVAVGVKRDGDARVT